MVSGWSPRIEDDKSKTERLVRFGGVISRQKVTPPIGQFNSATRRDHRFALD